MSKTCPLLQTDMYLCCYHYHRGLQQANIFLWRDRRRKGVSHKRGEICWKLCSSSASSVVFYQVKQQIWSLRMIVYSCCTFFQQVKEIFSSYFDTSAVDRINFDAEIVEGLQTCKFFFLFFFIWSTPQFVAACIFAFLKNSLRNHLSV